MKKYIYAFHHFNNNFGYQWGEGFSSEEKLRHRETINSVLNEINLPDPVYKGNDNLGFSNDEYEYMYFFPGEVTISCKKENYETYMEVLNHYFGGLDKNATQRKEELSLYNDSELEEKLVEVYKKGYKIFKHATSHAGVNSLKDLLGKEFKDIRLRDGLYQMQDAFMNKVFDMVEKIK